MTLQTGRRSKLPVPKPESSDVSLWSLLCRNIGKDLSKISMPVTLNEPLNMLQVRSTNPQISPSPVRDLKNWLFVNVPSFALKLSCSNYICMMFIVVHVFNKKCNILKFILEKNWFQKLCEELEYSDLLDRAAETENKYERMVSYTRLSESDRQTDNNVYLIL